MDDAIYDLLQNLIKTNEPVRFYNTYRGMPVNFSGNILKMIGKRALFKVSNLQIYNIILNKGTYIKISRPETMLYAQAADYSMRDETVDLWGFDRRANNIGLRNEIRVEPQKKMGAFLNASENANLPISIYDLSVRGMRFRFDIALFDPKLFVIGRRMPVLFYIPTASAASKGMMINYDIELRNVMTDRSRKNIYVGALSYPDKNAENYLVRYLAYRQKELLVELKALCNANLL